MIGPGTLLFTGANVVTKAATILLDGVGSNILNSSTAASALTNFATQAAAGSFTIHRGRNFTTLGNFSNAGTVNISGSGSVFRLASASAVSPGASVFTNQREGAGAHHF